MGIPAKTLALAEKHYTFKYIITMKVMQLGYQKRFSAGPIYREILAILILVRSSSSAVQAK